jgi:hypothetical protein
VDLEIETLSYWIFGIYAKYYFEAQSDLLIGVLPDLLKRVSLQSVDPPRAQ